MASGDREGYFGTFQDSLPDRLVSSATKESVSDLEPSRPVHNQNSTMFPETLDLATLTINNKQYSHRKILSSLSKRRLNVGLSVVQVVVYQIYLELNFSETRTLSQIS